MKPKYSPGQLAAWILTNAKNVEAHDGEYRFPCPKCGHKSHYFNVFKGIGFCHRAACKSTTSISSLEEAFGSTPETFIVEPTIDKHEDSPKSEIPPFPEDATPLIQRDRNSGLITYYPAVVAAIQRTRFISPEQMFLWSLHYCTTSERILIPIYYKGILRNYVSRAVWWQASATDFQRYDYPRHYNIKRWLFGWDEAKVFSRLTLVENTFNAIWLRDALRCSTAFGSDLSDEQIELLYKSKVKEVTFMWDYGAEERAQKAMKKLGDLGIDCRLVRFTSAKPQPDNWTLPELIKKEIMIWEKG